MSDIAPLARESGQRVTIQWCGLGDLSKSNLGRLAACAKVNYPNLFQIENGLTNL